MAGYDRTIDPITLDYVSDGAGGYEKTRTAATALHHQYRTPLGSWALDREAGIRSDLLERARGTNSIDAELVDILSQPAQRLIEAGRISAPEISIVIEGNRATEEIVVEDLQSGEEIPITKLAKYNP